MVACLARAFFDRVKMMLALRAGHRMLRGGELLAQLRESAGFLIKLRTAPQLASPRLWPLWDWWSLERLSSSAMTSHKCEKVA